MTYLLLVTHGGYRLLQNEEDVFQCIKRAVSLLIL